MSVIALANLTRSRWKNGLGTKATIATGDGWSLSHAWIDRDSQFSDFGGLDRTCVLLAGAGLTLTFEGGSAVDLPAPGTLQSFSGDWPAQARLHDGACHVLNVMTDRARSTHTVEVARFLPTAGYAVVLAGSVSCDGQVARFGDTVALPCDGEASSDLVTVAVGLHPHHARS